MLNKTVKFINGHFIDENNKRIVLKNHSEYVIIGEEGDASLADPLNKPPEKYRTSGEMHEEIRLYSQKKGGKFILIAKAEQDFYFRIGLGKRSYGIESHEFYFKTTLKEDLYAYKVKLTEDKWRLYNCKNTVNECYSPLNMYEYIFADSLNDAFSKTIAFYFPLNRKSSGNAKTEFFFADNEPFEPYKMKNESVKYKSIEDKIQTILKNEQ